jgi:rhodanese-related sulfurtransferase
MSKRVNKKETKPKKKTSRLIIIFSMIAIVIVALIIFSRFVPTGDTAALPHDSVTVSPLPKEISPAQANQLFSEGAVIVDVREQSEWIEGHIDGAVLIPLGELESRLTELPKDKQIVAVCRTGRRSAEARDILLNNGFAQVTSMAGGMTAWVEAGYPSVTGN